jgi:hypothetical protein
MRGATHTSIRKRSATGSISMISTGRDRHRKGISGEVGEQAGAVGYYDVLVFLQESGGYHQPVPGAGHQYGLLGGWIGVAESDPVKLKQKMWRLSYRSFVGYGDEIFEDE